MASPKAKKQKLESTVNDSSSEESIQEYTYLGNPNDTLCEDSSDTTLSPKRKIRLIKTRKLVPKRALANSDTSEEDDDCVITKVEYPVENIVEESKSDCCLYPNPLDDPKVQELQQEEIMKEYEDYEKLINTEIGTYKVKIFSQTNK